MENQLQQTQRPTQAADGDEPSAPGGSSLVQQAGAYANAARRARERCQHGHAAEHELRNRRNRSGQ